MDPRKHIKARYYCFSMGADTNNGHTEAKFLILCSSNSNPKPKIIVRPKIPQITQNLSSQIVCQISLPNPKSSWFQWKKASVVRGSRQLKSFRAWQQLLQSALVLKYKPGCFSFGPEHIQSPDTWSPTIGPKEQTVTAHLVPMDKWSPRQLVPKHKQSQPWRSNEPGLFVLGDQLSRGPYVHGDQMSWDCLFWGTNYGGPNLRGLNVFGTKWKT